jgi:hypothetical protein
MPQRIVIYGIPGGRFQDYSLLILRRDKLIAVLPANRVR